MSLLKDIQTKSLTEVKNEDLNDKLDQLANGADEVEHKGKKYRRSGPKNSSSSPGKWKEVPVKEGMSMIKEFSSVQTALKTSDATDAGKSDVADRASAASDIGFNLMRNTINSSGNVTGSDVADYIERAEELNDEVDTVPFGLETDDGKIVKVYVNAEQADKFEEAMKNMLGLEDDIEEAINRLAGEFDIVDVVWPRSDDDIDGDGEVDDDADLDIDDTSNLEDPEDDADFADDQYDVIAGGDTTDKSAPVADSSSGKVKDLADDDTDPEDDDATDDDTEEPDDTDPDDDGDDDEDDDDDDPDADPDKPKKKKKKKKSTDSAEPAEPATAAESTTRSGNVLNEEAEQKDYFAISSWGNPYRARDEEYFIVGPYETSAAARKSANVRLERGQPSRFKDWSSGSIKVVEYSKLEAALKKLKLNMPKSLQGKEYYERGLWRPSSLNEQNNQQENQMTTIGSRFLERVIQEAAGEDHDGVKDGFNIPLDSQSRAMASKLKLPFAKRLVAFHFMCGVPGRYMNTSDATEAISGAADMLRKKVAVRRAFTTFYEGLAAAKGFNIPSEDSVQEAKSDAKRLAGQDPEKIMSAKDAVKAAKKAISAFNRENGANGGDKVYLAQFRKLQANLEKAQKNLTKLTEEELNETLSAGDKRAILKDFKEYTGGFGPDEASNKINPYVKSSMDDRFDEAEVKKYLRSLAEGQLDEAKNKRGGFIQKLLESVLTGLGLPESLVATTGPSAVGAGIYKTAEVIEQDSNLERALRVLASRMGVRASDELTDVSESAMSGKFSAQTPKAELKKQAAYLKSQIEDAEGNRMLQTKLKQALKKIEGFMAEGLAEAVDVGNDTYAQAVTALVSALGIPDDILERRRTQIVQALRQRKATLGGRPQIITLMTRLTDMIAKNTTKNGNQAPADDTNESKYSGLSRLARLSEGKPLNESDEKAALQKVAAQVARRGYNALTSAEIDKTGLDDNSSTASIMKAVLKLRFPEIADYTSKRFAGNGDDEEGGFRASFKLNGASYTVTAHDESGDASVSKG